MRDKTTGPETGPERAPRLDMYVRNCEGRLVRIRTWRLGRGCRGGGRGRAGDPRRPRRAQGRAADVARPHRHVLRRPRDGDLRLEVMLVSGLERLQVRRAGAAEDLP